MKLIGINKVYKIKFNDFDEMGEFMRDFKEFAEEKGLVDKVHYRLLFIFPDPEIGYNGLITGSIIILDTSSKIEIESHVKTLMERKSNAN